MYMCLVEIVIEIVIFNGFLDKIKVYNKMLILLKVGEELFCKVDIVVFEILDVGVLGEGVLLLIC